MNKKILSGFLALLIIVFLFIIGGHNVNAYVVVPPEVQCAQFANNKLMYDACIQTVNDMGGSTPAQKKYPKVFNEIDSITGNPEGRSIAKAYYNALAFCAGTLNTPEDTTVGGALAGDFANLNDRDEDTGDNLDDFYIAAIRGMKGGDKDQSCSEGDLIKDAFDYFYKLAGKDGGWGSVRYVDLFCNGKSNGWFKAFDDDGNKELSDCAGTVNLVINNPDYGDKYYFELNDNSKLASYINNNIFNGRFDISADMTADERYYGERLIATNHCSDKGAIKDKPPSTDGFGDFYDVELQEKENKLIGGVRYFSMDHTWISPWFYYKVDTPTDDSGCEAKFSIGGSNGKKRLNFNDWWVKGVIGTLKDKLRRSCFSNYKAFYDKQYNYKTYVLPKMESEYKEDYEEWFGGLVSPYDYGEADDDKVIKAINDDATKRGVKACFIDNTTNSSANPLAECHMKEYIEALEKSNPDPSAPKYSYVDPSAGVSSDPSDPDSYTDPCYEAGLDSMAWILCPLTNNTKTTADGLEQVLRGWLQININDTFSNATEEAWGVFRNIANVVSIIVFLAVIISQLTGVGIDNYGIKKILPKLIVMSILVNLSYLICQLAVDLSNILGVGLDDLLRNIGESINSGSSSLTVSGIVTIVMGLLGGGAAVAGTALAAGGGVMVVVSLLIALIVALISILMFFIMLGARMVIVIIFTIISPVAFALYILPNTQGLFKKWWKVFQSALIVFPICGALYGASYIIKATFINESGGDLGFVRGIIAVVAPFLPFLLLPTLLKSALAGLGALGGTLSMLGNGLKRGVSSGYEGVKKTDRFQNAQEGWAEKRTARLAGMGKKKLDEDPNKWSKWQRFKRGGLKNIAKARTQYVNNTNKQALEDRMNSGVGFMAANEGQTKAAKDAILKDYMTLINSRTNNGEKEDELYELANGYKADGDETGLIAAARIAGRRKDTAARFMSRYITGYEEGGVKHSPVLQGSGFMAAVAKEIATGDNSAEYRASSPVGFEFASQITNGSIGEPNEADYAKWQNEKSNIKAALEHNLTDSKQLVGMKGSSLAELKELIENGKVEGDDMARLSNLIADAIAQKDTTGVWDSTKDSVIRDIQGALATKGYPASSGSPAPAPVTSPKDGRAREGEDFEWRYTEGEGP